MGNFGDHKIERDSLNLIGIGISPESLAEDFFFLIVIDDLKAQHKPVAKDGYLVLFRTRDKAEQAISFAGLSADRFEFIPTEEELTIDINDVFYILEKEDVDKHSILLNFYNMFFDLSFSAGFQMPARYRKYLYRFSSHLTFSQRIDTFFSNTKISRRSVINASLWLSGSVLSRVIFLDDLIEP